LIDAGDMVEIKAFCRKLFAGCFGFAGRVQLLQYAAVTPQDVIDIPYQVITVAVELIIVIIATQVITKFFIGTALQWRTAI
jgi:hypothetical protein